MKTLKEYIHHLQANGKYFFSKKDALSFLEINENQFRLQACRLYRKKTLKNLGHGFFMIIPAEYLHFGSLPPHWIIDPLMKYLNVDYYVGLLSAASLYGATHQQPMTFQVIANKQMRNIQLERGNIEFHFSKESSFAIEDKITVPTGYAKISTKEQTIVDLIHFHAVSGYLSNVAANIRDLAENCQPDALSQVVKNVKMESVLQRLGYILEILGFFELANIVEKELSQRKIHYIFLRPDFYIKKGKRIPRWKLILNDTLEVEA